MIPEFVFTIERPRTFAIAIKRFAFKRTALVFPPMPIQVTFVYKALFAVWEVAYETADCSMGCRNIATPTINNCCQSCDFLTHLVL